MLLTVGFPGGGSQEPQPVEGERADEVQAIIVAGLDPNVEIAAMIVAGGMNYYELEETMIDQNFLEEAKHSVLDGDRALALELANMAIELGYDPKETIEEAFVPGIIEIGDLFESGEVFLPEVMMAAEAIKAAVAVLNEVLEKSGRKQNNPAKVVLATVEADLHDTGKGIVASLMEANGFEVIDLGRDVSAEKIIQAALNNDVADPSGREAEAAATGDRFWESYELQECLRKNNNRRTECKKAIKSSKKSAHPLCFFLCRKEEGLARSEAQR